MDDIKLFAENEKQLKTFIQTIRIYRKEDSPAFKIALKHRYDHSKITLKIAEDD